MEKINVWAKKLKQQIILLYFAYKDPIVPWYAKVFTICIVAYALSPIDLIPDFIPILGYLDDIIIVPLGIMFALKMIPKDVISNCESKADEMMKKGKPKNWIAGIFIILIWCIIIVWVSLTLFNLLA